VRTARGLSQVKAVGEPRTNTARLAKSLRPRRTEWAFPTFSIRSRACWCTTHSPSCSAPLIGIGQRLFEADGIDTAEVEAQVPLPMLRRLMALVRHPQGAEAALDIGERLDLSAIHTEVTLAGAKDVRWPARVDRVASGLEPRTRAARVVLVVDEPYRNARPPERPILQRDMHLRVRLSAASPEPALVIPAAAVHQGEVFTVDAEDRLERRPVAVAFEQGDLAVIRSGLAPGDRVIVDDPIPTVAGLRVEPPGKPQRRPVLAEGAHGLGLSASEVASQVRAAVLGEIADTQRIGDWDVEILVRQAESTGRVWTT